jgi:hypothetical protein
VKIQFDPNQSFQLDAVAAVTDLFDGQPQGAPEYAVISLGQMEGLFAGQDRSELMEIDGAMGSALYDGISEASSRVPRNKVRLNQDSLSI